MPGLGKTLGYLAPAYLWARRNNAPVWVSTYTKNLQRQLDQETARLTENPEERQGRIVKWDDVDFDISTLDFDLLDGEGSDEEADPADAGALVEDPSQASSTEPTEAG